MKIHRIVGRHGLILGTAAFFAAMACFVTPQSVQAKSDDDKTYRALALLGETFERIRASYHEEVDDEQLIEAAINGMLRSLDPYSLYLNEKRLSEINNHSQGKFGGIGIEITLDESGYIWVISPIDDTPAAKAGILPDDLITHVNDTDVQKIGLHEAVKMMRGPIDSELSIKVVRDKSEVFDVALVRKVINLRSVRSRILEEKDGKINKARDIGYLRITGFSLGTTKLLQEEINALKEKATKPLQGIVVDVRNNPGGLLHEAIGVSDTFLERGEVVSVRGRSNEQIQRFHATDGDMTNGLPIVVLINKGSASASEIIAGALQDQNRATIIGSSSFGKGSVQSIIPVAQKKAAIKMTTQLYYTPSGKSINKVGLTPDIKIDPLPPIKNENGSFSPPERDVQLEEAINFLQNAHSLT